jgi:starvation-inducible DNA-binding protein
MHPNIGLLDEQREGAVAILNTLLADEYLLYTKTRNYHWNVVGPQFNDLHKFFEAQYNELNEIVDDVAERSRTLGATPSGR